MSRYPPPNPSFDEDEVSSWPALDVSFIDRASSHCTALPRYTNADEYIPGLDWTWPSDNSQWDVGMQKYISIWESRPLRNPWVFWFSVLRRQR